MTPVKSFLVFGEPVDVIVSGSMSGGSFAVLCLHNSPAVDLRRTCILRKTRPSSRSPSATAYPSISSGRK